MKNLRKKFLSAAVAVALCLATVLAFGGCTVLEEWRQAVDQPDTELTADTNPTNPPHSFDNNTSGANDPGEPPSEDDDPPAVVAETGFRFESGDLNHYEKSYSSTFLDGENLAEVRYYRNQKEREIFPSFQIDYNNQLRTFDVSFPDRNYRYQLSFDNDIESVTLNSNKVYTFEYQGDRLFRMTDHQSTYAYRINVDDDGNAVSRTLYLYLGNSLYIEAITAPYPGLPDTIDETVSVSDQELSPTLTERTVTANGQTRTVTIEDGVVTKETVTEGETVTEIEYVNDVYGNKLGFLLNGEIYYYVYDYVGNVTDVLTDTGTVAARYFYDNIGEVTNVTGPEAAAIRKYNSFAFRAWDDWYYHDAGKFYDVGGVLYYVGYAAFRGFDGTEHTFGNFMRNPLRYSIRNGAGVYSNSKPLAASPEKRIRDKVVRQVSLKLSDAGLSNLANAPVFDSATNALQYRAEVFTLQNAFNHDHAAAGQVYLVSPDDDAAVAASAARLSDMTGGTKYLFDGTNSIVPAKGVFHLKGHFIIDDTYVQYESDVFKKGLIVYRTFLNDPGTYDTGFGNLYNYDTGLYDYFAGSTGTGSSVEIIGNVIYEFDYDAVMQDFYNFLEATEAFQSYEIEDCEAQYLSLEAMAEIERCNAGNLVMNGMTYDELLEYYDGDLDFTFVDGDLVQTSNLPKEEPINWKNFLTKVGVGAGVILIAATVTVVTGGTATPVMCFLATSASLALTASVGGAVGAAVEYAVTGDANAALGGFADGFSFTAILASTAAVAGVFPALCFPAGTPVHTENGLAPIEAIRVGDRVLAYDEAAGNNEYKPVTRLYRNRADQLVNLRIGEELLQATPSHPFYVPAIGWLPAKDLKPGYSVLQACGSYAKIKSVETVSWYGEVYNFQVANHHNYYVGQQGVLVHNTCASAIGSVIENADNLGKIIGGSAIVAGSVGVGVGVGIEIRESFSLSQSYERKKAKVEEKVKELEKTLEDGDFIIYRWGNKTHKNLTPRLDDDVLSFSTNPNFSGCCITTFNTINQTGILNAYFDKPTLNPSHVAVSPLNGDMVSWKYSRENAETNPHPYTVLLYSLVI